jgi:hypothetical protein
MDNLRMERFIRELAARHEVSPDAVMALLQSLVRSGGASAQFSHPELGGSGQWLAGGMTQIGDMFNNALRAKVDALCAALAPVAREQAAVAVRPSQSQSQYQGSGFSSWSDSWSDFGQWWPSELGAPSATGAQNHVRYAYFPESRRLAIDVAGSIKVFDTLDYQISGVAQQQGPGSSVIFTSQKGNVDVARLPLVSEASRRAPREEPTRAPPGASQPGDDVVAKTASAPQPGGNVFAQTGSVPQPGADVFAKTASAPQPADDVFAMIERLHELKEKGILSEEEFGAKKKDLLGRI